MQGQGLHIQDITPRIFAPEKAKKFVSALTPALQALNLNAQKLLEGTAPLQYVIRASKIKTGPIHLAGLMLNPQAGMNEVRMIHPLRSVASLPGVQVSLSSNKVSLLPATSETPKIMIWQRQLLRYDDNSIERIRSILKAGYVLISEFDDDPDHWPMIESNKHLNFQGVHAVQTSTKPLADKLSKFNPEVKIFENCLERAPDIVPDKWNNVGKDKALRLFFGALNRHDDWKEWMKPLNNFFRRHPNSAEIDVIHDKRFFDSLETERKRFTPTCNYITYIERMRHSHIALLPLRPTPFNQKKSDLKFIESAGCNVAALASPTVYASTIQHGVTGKICQDGCEVEQTLEEWIQNPKDAEAIALSAHEWCNTHRLQNQQAVDRLQWYLSLWNKREELNQSLLKRVPELCD